MPRKLLISHIPWQDIFTCLVKKIWTLEKDAQEQPIQRKEILTIIGKFLIVTKWERKCDRIYITASVQFSSSGAGTRSGRSFGANFLFSQPGKAGFISYIRVTSAKIYRAQQKSKNVPKNMEKFSVVRLHLRRDKELGRRCLTQRVFYISYFYIWQFGEDLRSPIWKWTFLNSKKM